MPVSEILTPLFWPGEYISVSVNYFNAKSRDRSVYDVVTNLSEQVRLNPALN